jgi:hypothetical protein
MSKQEKPPISPHWRRLDKSSGVVGRPSGRPAAAISRTDTITPPKPTLPSDQADKAPSAPQPLPAAAAASKLNPILSDQPFWQHIPVFSFLIPLWLRMSKWVMNSFVKDEAKPATQPQNHDEYDQLLAKLWVKIKAVLFWGTGAFLVILPFRWILGQVDLMKKSIVGGVSSHLDTKKPSAIPSWIKEILVIVVGTLLLPLYLREKIMLGMFRGLWFVTKQTFLFGTRVCLCFPLAVFLAILLIGPDWLAPDGYPNPMNYSNVHQWWRAVDYIDGLRINRF